MRKKLTLLIMVLGLMTLLAPPVSAQSQLSITNSYVEIDFPYSVTFHVSAQSNLQITEARLRYSVEESDFTDVTAEISVVFTPATTIDAEWVWDMRYVQGLPPGTIINYWWICKDNGGAIAQTELQQLTFNDERFSWQVINADMMTLYWYEGNESFAQELLTTAQDAVARLGNETGAYLNEPIRLYVYASSADLIGSMIYPQEWTGAVTFQRFACISIGVSTLELTWGKRTIAHELTHLVTYQMTHNPYNYIPTWLEEGLAMYNEGPLSSQFTSPLTRAINTNTLLSVQTLASTFSAYADIAILSYAESYSIVDYLIRTYGKDKMFQLLDTFRQGSTYDGALRRVYGFDTKGLNTEWQNSLGTSGTTGAYLHN